MRFHTDLSEKRLQLLKQAFPGAERVALLANPRIAIAPAERRSAELVPNGCACGFCH